METSKHIFIILFRINELRRNSDNEIAKMEVKLNETNLQHQSDIEQLKDQSGVVIENIRKHYEDILDEKSNELGKTKYKINFLIDSLKQDIRREFHNKKTHKDTMIQHNILQEIKRFESNMQVKKKDRPLSMSQLQLKPERNSTSNLHKIEELVKVI